MSYSVHRLNIQNHFHIIGRQDGVTGDTIKANDEIVFCASCQSVFLKDSWEYMSKNHCNQSETLDFVPSPVPKLIIRKGDKSNDKLIYEVKDELRYEIYRILDIILAFKTRFFPILFSIGLIALIWYIVPKEYGISGKDSALTLLFSFVILFLGYIFGISAKKTKKVVKEFSELKILETGIITNEKFYYYNQIENINSYKTNTGHKLVFQLKDKHTITKEFPVRNYERTKPFYLALAWAAQFVEINFYTRDEREYGLMKSIEKNYAGRIWVADNFITS